MGLFSNCGLCSNDDSAVATGMWHMLCHDDPDTHNYMSGYLVPQNLEY
jgi:hypothetical protein